MDKLNEKIMLDRLSELGELPPGERIDVRGSEEHSASMAENKLLASLASGAPKAPDRLRMLAQVTEGRQSVQPDLGGLLAGMGWIFSRRSMYLPAVFSVALIALAAVLCTLMLPGRSVAYMDGYMLVYDLGPTASAPVATAGAMKGRAPLANAPRICDGRVIGMQAALGKWSRQRRLAMSLLGQQPRNIVSFTTEETGGHTLVKLSLARADERLLGDIQRAMSRVDGVPAPEVTDATWISAGKIDLDEQGMSVVLGDRVITMPPGFTEQEFQQALNEWLEDNRPGYQAQVAFVESDGGRTDVQVQLLELPRAPQGSQSGDPLLRNGVPGYVAGH